MSANISPSLGPLVVPMGDLVVNERNPRRGDVDAVARSMNRFGQRVPIVYRFQSPKPRARKKKVVIAGNHRYLAAELLGWDEIAAVDADDLSPEEAKAFALADNRTSDLATYDDHMLADLLTDLMKEDETLVVDAGWDDLSYVEFIAHTNALPDDDDQSDVLDVDRDGLDLLDVSITEPEVRPDRGSVWRLGRHTLVVAGLIREWQVWVPYLKPDMIFLPFPNPYVPLFLRPDQTGLLVQPDPYMAGHVIDKWNAVEPEAAVQQ